nr:hypothetical protein [uncultured Bdellovibrio sp.]
MRHFKFSYAFFILVSFILASQAQAYPDFIGYSYSSCITCHYNGLGGGGLNDYGRALYATEITARDPFFPKKMEEEEIAAKSGFLGSKPMPWWIRPGLKYRGLWLQMDPGSKASMERFINMQNDVNLTFFGDKKQTYTLVTTTSYTGIEPYYGKTNTWFAKEYYIRWKKSNNFWLYVGQMDKAFGIRNVDHTAVNRKAITLGQFDQSQGAIAHFTYPDWDVAVNAFFGNGAQEDAEKQKGFSVAGEYQVFEKFKIGGSALSSQSDLAKWNLLAFTTRMGLSKGSAIMAEAGFKEKTDKLANTKAQLGTYALVETMVNLTRGYNLLSVIEHSKSDISKSSSENMKWSLGALMFPLPRLELRAMATNAKTYTDSTGAQDAWALQGQIHVSY